ncbi:hypothetical protein Tco_1414121 [Tanacetum coccineum]
MPYPHSSGIGLLMSARELDLQLQELTPSLGGRVELENLQIDQCTISGRFSDIGTAVTYHLKEGLDASAAG